MTCETCTYLSKIDDRLAYCRRFPPTFKQNGKVSYPIIERTLISCGEYKLSIALGKKESDKDGKV